MRRRQIGTQVRLDEPDHNDIAITVLYYLENLLESRFTGLHGVRRRILNEPAEFVKQDKDLVEIAFLADNSLVKLFQDICSRKAVIPSYIASGIFMIHLIDYLESVTGR